MKVELLGLPGVGKSYYFQNAVLNTHSNPRPVELGGLSPAKVKNIVKGAFHKPAALFHLVKMVVRSGSRSDFRRCLILFERIGRLISGQGAAVDEGPLQAVWGLYHSKLLTPHTHQSCQHLLRLIFCSDQLIYVYAGQATRAINIHDRARKHQTVSASQQDVARARAWMAVIVLYVRSEKSDFVQSHRVQRPS